MTDLSLATKKPSNQSSSSKNSEVQVVPRDIIPVIHSVTQEDGEHDVGDLRDFKWHDALKDFLPNGFGASFSWVQLKLGHILQPHVHPIKTMIIIVKGSGRLTGQKNQLLNEGDTVIVPPGCSHGFECQDEEGFHALSIQFEGGLYTNPEAARVEFLK